jgi:hypothetical protein
VLEQQMKEVMEASAPGSGPGAMGVLLNSDNQAAANGR